MTKEYWQVMYRGNRAYDVPMHHSGSLIRAARQRFIGGSCMHSILNAALKTLDAIFGVLILTGAGMVIVYGLPVVAALLGAE